MTTNTFTATQLAVLAHAVAHNDGQITWFPDNIKGGARTKVLESLDKRDVAIRDSLGGWFVCYSGYKALGVEPRMPAPTEQIGTTGASQVLADEIGTQDPTDAEIAASNATDPEIEAAVAAVEAAANAEAKTRRTRANSKQATVIAMLKRPEGATIAQICEATGWQQHTVRGTFAGAFKKQLGLNLVSVRDEGGDRVYRLA